MERSVEAAHAKGQYLTPTELKMLRHSMAMHLINLLSEGGASVMVENMDCEAMDYDVYAFMDHDNIYKVRSKFDERLTAHAYRQALTATMLLVVLGSHGQRASTIQGSSIRK